MPLGRKFVCVFLLVVAPRVILAEDSAGAILRPQGDVKINGAGTPASWALVSHDVVRTESGAAAQLDASGSSVVVASETMFQFEGSELVLEHGTLLVNTNRSLRVRVGCIKIWPVVDGWTKYEVTDVDGEVRVFAQASDVNVEYGTSRVSTGDKPSKTERVTVRQGERTTRDEHCAVAEKAREYASAPANRPLLETPVAKWTGVGLAGAVTCVALCRGDNPVSPSTP